MTRQRFSPIEGFASPGPSFSPHVSSGKQFRNLEVYLSHSPCPSPAPRSRRRLVPVSLSTDVSFEQRIPESYDDFWCGDDMPTASPSPHRDLLLSDLENPFADEDFERFDSYSPKPKTTGKTSQMSWYTASGPSRNGWCSSSARTTPANTVPVMVSHIRHMLETLGAPKVPRAMDSLGLKVDKAKKRTSMSAGSNVSRSKVLTSVQKHAQNVKRAVTGIMRIKPAFSPPFLSGAAARMQAQQANDQKDGFSGALFNPSQADGKDSAKKDYRRRATEIGESREKLQERLKLGSRKDDPKAGSQAIEKRIEKEGSTGRGNSKTGTPKAQRSYTPSSDKKDSDRSHTPFVKETSTPYSGHRSNKRSGTIVASNYRDIPPQRTIPSPVPDKDGPGLLLKVKLKSSKQDRLQALDLLRKEKEDPNHEERSELRLPLGDLARIRDAWARYDRDNSGDLDPEECLEALADIGLKARSQVEKTEIARLMEEVDDGDGGIDFGEFCALVVRVRLRLQESLRAELARAFLDHDDDSTGTLNRHEMLSVIERFGFLAVCHSPHDPDRAKREVMQEINDATQEGESEVDFAGFEILVQRVRELMYRMKRDREWELCREYSFSTDLFQQSRHEILDLYSAFVSFDADGSGELDKNEVVTMLAQFGVLPRGGMPVSIKNPRESRKGGIVEHQDVLSEVLADIREDSDEDDESDLDFRQYVLLVQKLRERAMEDRRELLYEVFRHYDQDQSGELSMSEVSHILEDLGLSPRTRDELEEIQQLYEDVDKDGSESLDFEEFAFLCARVSEKLRAMQREKEKRLALALRFSEQELDDLHTAFEALDTNGNEGLSINEVRRAMELMRRHIESEQLRETFNKLDTDSTGFLDFSSFLRLMRMIEDEIEKESPDKGKSLRVAAEVPDPTRTGTRPSPERQKSKLEPAGPPSPVRQKQVGFVEEEKQVNFKLD